MGIFSKTEDKKEAKPKAATKKAVMKKVAEKPVKEAKAPKKEAAGVLVTNIIMNPRITEKAAHISDHNVYTFDVYPRATKIEIMKAVKAAYNVTPLRVNILAIPTKMVWRTTANGVKRGGKKAYVTLKKGDKIEFI
jgi:large subunit ribosomal protein L23